MHISTESPTIELAIEIEKRHVFTKFEKDPWKHRESQCAWWAERIMFTVGSTASYTFVNVFNSDVMFSRFQIFWYLLHLVRWFIYALSNRQCNLPCSDNSCLLTCTFILQNLLLYNFLCVSVYLYLRMGVWFDRRTLWFHIRNTRSQFYLISMSVFCVLGFYLVKFHQTFEILLFCPTYLYSNIQFAITSDGLTHWPLGDVPVSLKVKFSNLLYRIVARELTINATAHHYWEVNIG